MEFKHLFLIFSTIASSFSQKLGNFCDDMNQVYCRDGTQCIDNVCKCGPGLDYIDIGVCAIKAGDTCDSSWSQCVWGSECDSSTSKCVCKAPSTPLPNGGCSSNNGERCSGSHTCTAGAHLRCVNNQCTCSNGTISLNQHDMMTRVHECYAPGNGAQCSVDGIGAPKCIEDAQCLNGQCQCNDGFAPNTDGFCKKIHSMDCGPNYQMISNECLETGGLACIDDKCLCLGDKLAWDSELKKCVAQLGQACSGAYQSCSDPNAYCGGERNTCICIPGFIRENGVCIPEPTKYCECSPNGSENLFDCAGKSCGYYSLKNNPTRYVQCMEGTGIVHDCPQGLEFNEQISSCDYPQN